MNLMKHCFFYYIVQVASMPLRYQCPAAECRCSNSITLHLRFLESWCQSLLMHFFVILACLLETPGCSEIVTSHSLKNDLAHFHRLCYIFWLKVIIKIFLTSYITSFIFLSYFGRAIIVYFIHWRTNILQHISE